MNKAALIEAIAVKVGVSKKETEAMVDAFTDVITSTLQKGDEASITGFGTFMPKVRTARAGVNPQNPTEKIQIPAVTIPKFKAGKALKDALKQKPETPEPEETTNNIE